MELSDFIKPIKIPAQFEAPLRLQYENLTATPLSRQDGKGDLLAVNSNRELIRHTRGGSWPEGELSEEYNNLDLAWHERENRDGTSFAYSVRNLYGEYIGCFYLYPLGTRRSLSQELLKYDYDASWWTTNKAYTDGDYDTLFHALSVWTNREFQGLGRPYYSNVVIPSE